MKQSLPVIQLRVAPSEKKRTKPMKCGVTVYYTHNGSPSHTRFDDFYKALDFAREVCGWAESGTPCKVIFEVFE